MPETNQPFDTKALAVSDTVTKPLFVHTTEEAVRSVYPDTADLDIAPAIQTAEAMIQANMLDTGCGANYTPERLELIARYLAAHIFQIQHGVLTSKSAGAASESYAATLDKGLLGTLHGQQAMLLDSNGCLAQAQARLDAILQGQLNAVPVIDIFPSRVTSFGTRAGRLC